MKIFSFLPIGYEGHLVSVEVDVRNGIPGVEIVGFAGTAVKEARERVRTAILNCGFEFPLKKILINLSPAGIPKSGASFDLAIAVAILAVKEGWAETAPPSVLIMGELRLSGEILPVKGIIAAYLAALNNNISTIVIPRQNGGELDIIQNKTTHSVSHLSEILEVLSGKQSTTNSARPCRFLTGNDNHTIKRPKGITDFSAVRGQRHLKRALEIAVAGNHNVFMFGPPGCGKTLSAGAMAGILPDLTDQELLEVLNIHSLAGVDRQKGALRRPPFRSPHHSASVEGMIGGGKWVRPGEISLSHRGLLFLDEAPEFRKNVLQSLREPVESRKVTIVRASDSYWFPANFMLVLAANPCPCGNLGREGHACMCSSNEIGKYWKKIGSPLLDRLDIRIQLKPAKVDKLVSDLEEPTSTVFSRVVKTREIQTRRYRNESFSCNASIVPEKIQYYCALSQKNKQVFRNAVESLHLSSRASISALKIARTVADHDGSESIGKYHLYEALQYRRVGDLGDSFR